MASKRSVLRKIRSGAAAATTVWKDFVNTPPETLAVEVTSVAHEPVVAAAVEDFCNQYPKNTEAVVTARQKTTRKTMVRKKTTKSKKSS